MIFAGESNATMDIFDVTGKLIRSYKLDANKETILIMSKRYTTVSILRLQMK
jgi:hypothetical protein